MAITRVKRVTEDDQNLPTRHFSSKQEKSVAKVVGGRQIPNSGAGMWQKGDVINDLFLLECKTKTTKSESISVKKEWIEKNKKEAFFMQKDYTAVVINFGPDEPNYYIIDEDLFIELQEYLRLKKESN